VIEKILLQEKYEKKMKIVSLMTLGYPKYLVKSALELHNGDQHMARAHLESLDSAKEYSETRLIFNIINDVPDDADMEQELNSHSSATSFLQRASQFVAQIQQNHAEFNRVDPISLQAVSLYTQESFIYKDLNTTLRSGDEQQIASWKVYMNKLMRGLRHVPVELNTKVYRGLSASSLDIDQLQVGQVLLFKAFTSCSKKKSVAQNFGQILLKIKCKTGRYLKQFSAFPSEEEVLLSAFSCFKVVSVTPGTNTTKPIVKLEEVHERTDTRNVLWVDDNPIGNKDIITHCLKKGIVVAHVQSTEEALDYLDKHGYLLRRNRDGFRIISDMARKEGTIMNYYAGIDLLRELRSEKYGYNGQVLIYTGARHWQEKLNRSQEYGSVNITLKTSEADEFACFNL
jgi:CheY-like chemotaxis protein